MAHELEINGEGKASMAWAIQDDVADRGTPWHRLGTPMLGLQTAPVMLKAASADFEVGLAPVYAAVPAAIESLGEGTATFIDADGNLMQMIKLDSGQATWRTNPHTGLPQALAQVGDRYTVVQNANVMDRALAVVGATGGTACVSTLGVLDEGRRFFAAIDLGALYIDPTGINDKIERWLLVYSSHDGTVAVTYANTDVRAVCQNTVTAGLRRADRTFRAKHTPSVEARLDEAQAVLEFSTEWATSFNAMAEDLLRVSMTPSRLDTVFERAFPLAAGPTDRQRENHRQVQAAVRGVYGNARNAKLVGNNGWAAYNAVVEYLDYYRPGEPKARAEASMDDASWVAKRKITTQEAILALA